MSVQLQHRRGTATQNDAFTGAAGEFTFDTTNNRVRAHDGTTAGGWPHARMVDLQNSSSTVAVGAGTGNAITGAFTPAITSLQNGTSFLVRASAVNSSSTPTFKADGTAAKTIVKGANNPLEAGDILGVGYWFEITYDTVLDKYVLQNPARSVLMTGSYSVRGMIGLNNVTTPNTQFDLSATLAILWNPSTSGVLARQISTITNNVATAGPAANGRDQAGAFTAGSWIRFYFIGDAAGNVATISSAAAPPTGPTLPTGYTHWAYAGAVRFDGSSALLRVRLRGDRVIYDNEPSALTGGTATAETSIDLSTLIPPEASTVSVNLRQSPTGSAGGFCNINTVLRHVTGQNAGAYSYQGFNNSVSSAQGMGYSWNVSDLANLSQALIYLLVNTTGTGSLTLTVANYRIPNGG